MNEATSEYAEYISHISNKEVNLDTIITAASVAKKTLNNYNEEDLTFWKETTKQENIERAKLAFPYSYDPNNKTEAYLELSNSEEETKPLKR